MLTNGAGSSLTRVRLAIAAVALLGTPALANDPLDIRVRRHFSVEPATLALDVVVERHAENRAMQVFVDSVGYYRSSLVQLDGDAAPRISTVRYKDLPAGSYEIRAILYGPGEKPRATAIRGFEVLARAGR